MKSTIESTKTEEDIQLQRCVGNRLILLMDKHGTSNDELSDLLHRSSAHVSELRNGRTAMNVIEIAKICSYYGISENELLRFSEILPKINYPSVNKSCVEEITNKLILQIKGLSPEKQEALLRFITPE